MPSRRPSPRPNGRPAGTDSGDADLRAELEEARAENRRLRAELSVERAGASVLHSTDTGTDSTDSTDSVETAGVGARVPSPVMLVDLLDALGLAQQMLDTRAQGDASVDEHAVGIALSKLSIRHANWRGCVPRHRLRRWPG